MGRLAEVIEREFGFPIRAEFSPRPHTLVAATVLQLLKENADRVNWLVFNLGDTVAYVSHTPDPSSTNGYYLDKNGGHLAMDYKEDGDLVGYPLFVISDGTPTLFLKAVVGA